MENQGGDDYDAYGFEAETLSAENARGERANDVCKTPNIIMAILSMTSMMATVVVVAMEKVSKAGLLFPHFCTFLGILLF